MSAAASTLALTGGIVVLAGVILGRTADQIAELTGVGEMWTGWLLLAAATSLPEFVTDVAAVRLHAADLERFCDQLSPAAYGRLIHW